MNLSLLDVARTTDCQNYFFRDASAEAEFNLAFDALEPRLTFATEIGASLHPSI